MNRFHSALALSALAVFTVALGLTTNPAQAAPTSAIDTACPTQSPPAMPRAAFSERRHDVVRVHAFVQDGAVRDVDIVSGPRIYGAVIRTAMADYRCQVQPGEFEVSQEFEFDASNADH